MSSTNVGGQASLRDLQEVLWQISMLGDKMGFQEVIQPMTRLVSTINAATTAIAVLTAAIKANTLSQSLSSAGKKIQKSGAALDVISRGKLGKRSVLGDVGRIAGRMTRVAGKAVSGVGRAAAGIGAGAGALGTVGTLGVGALIAGGLYAAKEWRESANRRREEGRKSTLEESGFRSGMATTRTAQRYEESTLAIKQLIAFDQKRAENARALFLQKSKSVGMELEYQKKLFAIDEQRLKAAQSIEMLQAKGRQSEKSVANILDRTRKRGEAQDSATITRKWYRSDYARDEYGRDVDKSVLKATGLGNMFYSKENTNKDFQMFQKMAGDIRKAIEAGFAESLKQSRVVNEAMLEKLKALSSDGLSAGLLDRQDAFQKKFAAHQEKMASSQDELAYSRLMSMSTQQALDAGLMQKTAKGGYTFIGADGRQRVVEAKGKLSADDRMKQLRESYGDDARIEKLKQDDIALRRELYEGSAEVNRRGVLTSAASERIKDVVGQRQKISEQQREKYISHTAETIGMFDSSRGSVERLRRKRTDESAQEQYLLMFQHDAAKTQKIKEDFAERNAVKDARDKVAEKFGDEKRELANRIRLETAKREQEKMLAFSDSMRRSAEAIHQASLGIKESQAELSRKINRFQLDFELANLDTYGKTAWETSKAITKSDYDAQHAKNLSQINQEAVVRETMETVQLDTEKTQETENLKKQQMEERHALEKRQVKERMELEKQLIDAQLEYRKAEIRYEYEYRRQLDEAYNKARRDSQDVWVKDVSDEEVAEIFGEGKTLKNLTADQREQLAELKRAEAESAQEMSADNYKGLMAKYGLEGEGKEQAMEGLQNIIKESDKAQEALKKPLDMEVLDRKTKKRVYADIRDKVAASGLEGAEAAEMTKREREKAERNWDAELAKQAEIELGVKGLAYSKDEGFTVSEESLKRSGEAKTTLEALNKQSDLISRLEDASNIEKQVEENLQNQISEIEQSAAKTTGFDEVKERLVGGKEQIEQQKTEQQIETEQQRSMQEDVTRSTETRYKMREAEEKSARTIDKEDAMAQAELENARTQALSNMFIENRARNDRFMAEQAGIYSQGRIAQQNLRTDTLVSAMQQGGGGYTNTMIKYGIQSQYETIKNEMAARHKAETEQLESRGNVTEYERQELKNRQEQEAASLDNQKKLKDMMADRMLRIV